MCVIRNTLLTIVVALVIAGCGVLFLPYGEATVRVTATITFDGEEYLGNSIWRVKVQTQNGWPDSGINYSSWVLGDAVEFEIGDGTYVFLRPQSSNVMQCALQEHGDVEYFAEALPLFEGPCNADLYGGFTVVTAGVEGVPTFTNFAVNREGELLNDGGGKDTSPEIQAIADRNFALRSLTLTATSEPLPDGMVERFPWILDLPRTDVCLGRRGGEDSYCWSLGETYMQYFTTDLPE